MVGFVLYTNEALHWDSIRLLNNTERELLLILRKLKHKIQNQGILKKYSNEIPFVSQSIADKLTLLHILYGMPFDVEHIPKC